jgi:hypothetical protein
MVTFKLNTFVLHSCCMYEYTIMWTDWLTTWIRVILEKLTATQLVKKLPAFYATRRFITVFTTVPHWPLSWTRWIQSKISHHISLRSILIWGCIQKFPDWVNNEINNNKHSLRSNTKDYGGKTHLSDSQNSATVAPTGRELYHLQFSLQAAKRETFGYTLLLPSHLRLGLPSGLFPSGFPTKILYASLISPIRVTWPAHLILLDLITLIIFGEACKLWSSSLCSLLRPPATSYLPVACSSALSLTALPNYRITCSGIVLNFTEHTKGPPSFWPRSYAGYYH